MRAASADTRVASSVLLQQLLYLNVLFSPGWFTAFVVILARKYGQGVTLQDPDEVRIAMTIIWVITEPLRLLAGYTGNLRENVRLPAPPKPIPPPPPLGSWGGPEESFSSSVSLNNYIPTYRCRC